MDHFLPPCFPPATCDTGYVSSSFSTQHFYMEDGYFKYMSSLVHTNQCHACLYASQQQKQTTARNYVSAQISTSLALLWVSKTKKKHPDSAIPLGTWDLAQALFRQHSPWLNNCSRMGLPFFSSGMGQTWKERSSFLKSQQFCNVILIFQRSH